MTDKDTEAFEAWALGYLKCQYPFCDANTIKNMMIPYRSQRCTLEAAWQAARDHYAPKLTEKEAREIVSAKLSSHSPIFLDSPIAEQIVKTLRKAGVRFQEEA